MCLLYLQPSPLVPGRCSWVCQGLEAQNSDAQLGPCRCDGAVYEKKEGSPRQRRTVVAPGRENVEAKIMDSLTLISSGRQGFAAMREGIKRFVVQPTRTSKET